MQGLDARGSETILKEHCPEFYNSLVEEYPEGFPLSTPLPKDKQLYWEDKLRTQYHSAYPIYYFSKLDAFTFFAGMKAEKSKVKVMLGNYDAMRDLFDAIPDRHTLEKKKVLLRIACTIQRYYELPGAIFLSKLYVQWAQDHQENIKAGRGFAVQATQALGLVVLHGYGKGPYEECVKYDPSLTIDKDHILDQFLVMGLLTQKDLVKQVCNTRENKVTSLVP